MSERISWVGVDPCFGQMLYGLKKAFDSYPDAVCVSQNNVERYTEAYVVEKTFASSHMLIERTERQRYVLGSILLDRFDVIAISNLFEDVPIRNWQQRQMIWMNYPATENALYRLRWYLQFKPKVLVTEVPMKILRDEDPRNHGVSDFRKLLHKTLSNHAYSMTLFETHSSVHGYPDGTYKTFLIAWLAEKSPILSQTGRVPQTKTLADFFHFKNGYMSAGVRNLNFSNPYVEYYRTVLNEEPMPSDIESHNLLFRLESRGLVGQFLEWVNGWATTPADKAFAREVDAFVYSKSPVNNAPNVLSHISDRTQPGHLRNLLHPFANRFCTPVEVLDMIGVPVPEKMLEVEGPEEACAIIVDRELGRAQVNMWEDVGNVIRRILHDPKNTYEADSDFYVWDNTVGKRVSLVPKNRKRPRNVPA